MKRIDFVVILVCMAVFAACSGKKNEYVINGIVPDNPMLKGYEMLVYMSDYGSDEVLDSTIVSNGKFVFKGAVDSAIAVRLTSMGYYVDLILENGTITVDLSDPYSAKGTPLTNKLREFSLESSNLADQAREKLVGIDVSMSAQEVAEVREDIINEFLTKCEDLSKSYLHKHPNDALGAIVFYTWMQNQAEPSFDMFSEASKLVGDNVLSFAPIQQMAEYYNKLNKVAIGQPFIDFTISNGNLDGSSVSLSDYVGKGKYVLVDFWASWCQPCRMEMPNLAEVYKKHKGDKFEIVGVAVWDKREATIRAIEDDGSTWPQIIDAQTIPTDLYGIQGIPHIILFGPDGTIVARNLRGDNLKEQIELIVND